MPTGIATVNEHIASKIEKDGSKSDGFTHRAYLQIEDHTVEAYAALPSNAFDVQIADHEGIGAKRHGSSSGKM